MGYKQDGLAVNRATWPASKESYSLLLRHYRVERLVYHLNIAFSELSQSMSVDSPDES